jgi:hypothetical protein
LLLLLEVLEAQLDVGCLLHSPLGLENFIVVLECLLGLGRPRNVMLRSEYRLFRRKSIKEFGRHSRVEDEFLEALPVLSGVNVVCHCEHEVSGDEELRASYHGLVTGPSVDDPHAVVPPALNTQIELILLESDRWEMRRERGSP